MGSEHGGRPLVAAGNATSYPGHACARIALDPSLMPSAEICAYAVCARARGFRESVYSRPGVITLCNEAGFDSAVVGEHLAIEDEGKQSRNFEYGYRYFFAPGGRGRMRGRG